MTASAANEVQGLTKPSVNNVLTFSKMCNNINHLVTICCKIGLNKGKGKKYWKEKERNEKGKER